MLSDVTTTLSITALLRLSECKEERKRRSKENAPGCPVDHVPRSGIPLHHRIDVIAKALRDHCVEGRFQIQERDETAENKKPQRR